MLKTDSADTIRCYALGKEDGIADGRRMERGAIVAWLRNRSEYLRDSQNKGDQAAYSQLGSMAFEMERAVIHVERGEHEKGDDK